MKAITVSLTVLLLLISYAVRSGDVQKMSRAEYIALHKDDAVRDMQKTGVPASITLAQALLESNDGNSPLATEANNHFGIKCSNWNGPTFLHDDDIKNECFRKYNSVLESYDDHSDFLRSRPRYASLFQLDRSDYKGWARGLKKAGYATDPTYAERIIKIIEDNQLWQLDQGQVSQPEASISNAPILPVTPTVTETRVFVPSAEPVEAFGERHILQNNGIKYVIARKGDTFKSLASELNLGPWQLPKYNEMENDAVLEPGERIYIQPKKREGDKAYYIVRPGDSVHSISQETGVKSKFIYKYNNLEESQQPATGTKLFLREKL